MPIAEAPTKSAGPPLGRERLDRVDEGARGLDPRTQDRPLARRAPATVVDALAGEVDDRLVARDGTRIDTIALAPGSEAAARRHPHLCSVWIAGQYRHRVAILEQPPAQRPADEPGAAAHEYPHGASVHGSDRLPRSKS